MWVLFCAVCLVCVSQCPLPLSKETSLGCVSGRRAYLTLYTQQFSGCEGWSAHAPASPSISTRFRASVVHDVFVLCGRLFDGCVLCCASSLIVSFLSWVLCSASCLIDLFLAACVQPDCLILVCSVLNLVPDGHLSNRCVFCFAA